MAKFVYNNFKNANSNHILFKLNYDYHSQVSLKNKYDKHFRFFQANKLGTELRELINICCQNLLHAQDLQKQTYDKGVKLWKYGLSEKIWLNSKYIKMEQNWKLEVKFFELF